jgi:sporulation inhibitor KapD
MNYLVVDFEFTFYKRPVGRPRNFFAEIIEIGAVKLASETLEEAGKLQNFVKPHFFPKHAKDAMEFCMITDRDMKKAITFPEMLEKLAAMYEAGNTFFVAWGNSDYKVLDDGCKHHKLENPVLYEDYLDLAEAYKIWRGEENTPGLKAAITEMEVEADGLAHTAYDDAYNTGKVLAKMLEKGWTYEAYKQAKEEAAQK